jgi:hypothetical protein
MPQSIEVPVDIALTENSPNRSAIIAANNAQHITPVVQTSAPLTAGQWVLKATITPETTIPGDIIATVDFPATPARVNSATVEGPQKYVYVERTTPPIGGMVEKITVLLQ